MPDGNAPARHVDDPNPAESRTRVPSDTTCVPPFTFTNEEFEALRVASEWLLDNLTPDGARRPVERTRNDAAEMRDRLWTLLLRRHSDLRAIGYYFHRDELEEFTPKLQSRVGTAVASDDEVGDEVEAAEAAEVPAAAAPV